MKRNWDIIRDILLTVEEKDENKSVLHLKDFSEYDQNICSYHVKLLFQEKLLEGYMSKVLILNKPSDFSIYELTWKGHEFLDSIKDESIWIRVQDKLKDNSMSFSFELLKDIASKMLFE